MSQWSRVEEGEMVTMDFGEARACVLVRMVLLGLSPGLAETHVHKLQEGLWRDTLLDSRGSWRSVDSCQPLRNELHVLLQFAYHSW